MKNKIARVIGVICVLILVIFGIFLGRYWEGRKYQKADISVSAITARLTQASDLATARLEYRGLIRYEAGEIRFITQKGFTMIYNAHIKAGIDLSKAKVDVSGETITVTLPKAEIQDITIDPGSLEFYDEKFALFNFQDREDKEDTVTALQAAKEDAEKNAADSELLTTANEQAQRLIQELLAPVTKDSEKEYTIVFNEPSEN